MLDTFFLCTQRFCVKKGSEPLYPNEVMVKFQNRNEVQHFFNGAMKDKTNCKSVLRIAKNMAPSYCCRSIKNQSRPSNMEIVDNLISVIGSGNANVVINNDALKAVHQKNESATTDDKDKPKEHNFIAFVKRQADQMRNTFSKLIHADYHILENVYHFDENTKGPVPAIIDTSSIKTHSTGWKNFDDPFDIAALGALKAVATYHVGAFLKLGQSITAAAVIGSQSELVSGEYMVNGKSIIRKNWYGSYGLRYNLKTLSFEVPWVKFKGCSQGERCLVELTRKDRLKFHNNTLYNHPEMLIPPFQSMDDFLAAYKKEMALPEHDINKPITIG